METTSKDLSNISFDVQNEYIGFLENSFTRIITVDFIKVISIFLGIIFISSIVNIIDIHILENLNSKKNVIESYVDLNDNKNLIISKLKNNENIEKKKFYISISPFINMSIWIYSFIILYNEIINFNSKFVKSTFIYFNYLLVSDFTLNVFMVIISLLMFIFKLLENHFNFNSYFDIRKYYHIILFFILGFSLIKFVPLLYILYSIIIM